MTESDIRLSPAACISRAASAFLLFPRHTTRETNALSNSSILSIHFFPQHFFKQFLKSNFQPKTVRFHWFSISTKISLAFDQTCVRQRSNHAPEQGAGQHNYKPSRRATGLFTCPLLSWLRISKRTGWGLRKKSTATAWQPVTLHVSDMGFGEREGEEKTVAPERGVGHGVFL
jgi:hypothetical protein